MVERNRLNRAPLRGAYGIRTRAAAVRGRCPRPLDECARQRRSVAANGHYPSMLGRWLKRGEKRRAGKQQADPQALAVEGDPRGGLQSDEYRHSDPRELVEDEGVVMSGPAGSPGAGTVGWRLRAERLRG